MRWHEEKCTKDGFMRHPADSPTWQTFDHLHPEFAKDCRNVRLGLASDGFNPFNNMSSTHSTWPVVLIPYNLPPWMCMKQPYFMLSLLILGPSSPGNNIDVYLQPLVKERTTLWDFGIQTYDASQKENFQLHVALLWIISDFPGYAMLSRWSTKGEYACPNVCENIWGTLLDIEDKAKDYYNSRRDLREIGIRKELHPIETEPGKVYLPPSSFAMDKKQRTMFCNVLKKVKVPDGYQLMPTTLRKTLPKSVRYSLIRLSRYFRCLGTLKSYVRNKSRPEGSIAQGYLAEECINFCSLYLADYVETKFNRPNRNEEVHKEIEDGLDIFSESGHPLGRGKPTVFDAHILSKAHQYILFNCDAVTPYIEQHRRLIEEGHPQVAQHLKERLYSENFACWLAEHIDKLELP
ncbi:uncharacterized protein [Coffea arabica]|uniref:DUF4218 domain-containing protein n=1 Tax=Coffea arabica TaxID=13443 RepID=A0ABM4UEW0_COFAR